MRADLIRQGLVDPEVDNLLKVTSDGRKASIYNNPPGWGPVPDEARSVRRLCVAALH